LDAVLRQYDGWKAKGNPALARFGLVPYWDVHTTFSRGASSALHVYDDDDDDDDDDALFRTARWTNGQGVFM
jgi:hypothetical protein